MAALAMRVGAYDLGLNSLYLNCDNGCTDMYVFKTPWNINLKWVYFIVSQLHLNKADYEKDFHPSGIFLHYENWKKSWKKKFCYTKGSFVKEIMT